MTKAPEASEYKGSAGGWGSLKGISRIERSQKASPTALDTLRRLNKPGGTMCTSCAWVKSDHPKPFEFCENGAKATLWDLTSARCTPDFFARHTVTQLATWSDYELEIEGRLTAPMRYDPATDHYVETSWEEAFAAIGAKLRELRVRDPRGVTFYASGKAALEPSYLYAAFARMFGNNNLPDSSNMCHETTSVGLRKVTGSAVGTCQMEDFEHCDAIFYLGQNPGTNSPRILHPLQKAVKRGCKIVVFNPLKEKALTEFRSPQDPLQMTFGKPTQMSHLYLQVRPGGDIAALMGTIKRVLERDRQAVEVGGRRVLDSAFIEQHTHGLEPFLARLDAVSWDELEVASGVTRAEMEAAGDIYADATKVIGIYGMGLTQHVHGNQAIGLLVNLLLLGGNMGRLGAGCSPIRGHSNVQGQRTVGITERYALAPVEKYREVLGLETPVEDGHTTVEFLEALLDGSNTGFIGLGGNLARAVPDHDRVYPAWRGMELTVHIATKLNKTHCMPGKAAWLLPCLVRAEEDIQATGNQWVSIEDSFSHVSASKGKRKPASEALMSETAIICEIARATLDPHPRWTWDAWRADYARIRELIAQTYPEQFFDMESRMHTAGGFYRGNPAHERIWMTASGKAEFTTPSVLNACGILDHPGGMHLVTLRSNDQFNTTIYGFSDRLRGLEGDRMIVLVSPAEMTRLGLDEGEKVSLVTEVDDGIERRVTGLCVRAYDLPKGTLVGYFPELNPLVPLWYHDELAKTPASKGIPVRIER